MMFYFLNNLANNLIRKGKKTKANAIVFSIMKNIKLKSKKNPVKIFNRNLNKLNINLETISLNFFKTKNLKRKVRFSVVKTFRLQRKKIKFLINCSNLRYEFFLIDRISNEILDLRINKGLSLKKKKEIFLDFKKLRPSAIISKRKRKKKRVSRF